jgi:hypothetical protein
MCHRPPPFEFVRSLPGSLLACTYGVQPAMLLRGMIKPRFKATEYELGGAAPELIAAAHGFGPEATSGVSPVSSASEAGAAVL